MSIRLAILGLDPIQRDYLAAVLALAESNLIVPVAVGHRTLALARDTADILRVPPFDDMRSLLRESTPQVLLLDRPDNVSADFLAACLEQNLGILSLGPPVKNVAEARTLASVLEDQTHLLYIAPAFIHTPGFAHGTHPDLVARPLRFASADFHAFNHAAAKSAGKDASQQTLVRSLSVLAWDVLSAFLDLLDLPESIFASLRGTTAAGDIFTDISGAAGLVLRFTDADSGTIVATASLSDRAPARRSLLLLTPSGSARLDDFSCQAFAADGSPLDATTYPIPQPADLAAATIKTFLEQFLAPTSPHRGWPHRLEPLAACMEALLISHRTGQPENPERFLNLRR